MRTSLVKPLSRPFVCTSCRRSLQAQRRRVATIKSPELYDIVCVGGGPAGLSLLTALRASPNTSSLKLALIESQDLSPATKWSPPPDEYSNRVSSLTPSSQRFLESIGAWQELDKTRIQPYERMQVWDGVSGSRISFDWPLNSWPFPPPQKDTTVAYMNENTNLVHALLTRLSSLGNYKTFSPAKVSSITLGPSDPPPSASPNLSSWPHLTLSTGTTLAARLLVGADGANSLARTFAQIPSRGWDYDRHGVVATLQFDSPPHTPVAAYQRFLPTGPIAMLPLPGRRATLVWSTTPAHAAHLKSLAPEDFLAMVNAAFRLMPVDLEYMHTLASGQADELAWRLEHTPTPENGVQIPGMVSHVQPGSVASFPLKLRHADTYATHRVALIGDAAHTTHPLAGQGLNMGIGDVESLVGAIAYAAGHGMDVGDQLSLERYNAERWNTNHMLLGVVDKLHKLYSVGSGPVVWGRSLGLDAVNRMGVVKQFLMRQAAGA